MSNTNSIRINDLTKQLECYYTKCGDYYNEILLLKDKVENASNIIINAYNEDRISKKEFINKMMQVRKIQINSIVYSNYVKCIIKNCYEVHKKLLDNILINLSLINIKYKKIIDYKVNDFKNIMLLYLKHHIIMPIANSK